MAEIRTRGLVLRYADYRDNARMITLLTPEGRADASVYGSKKPTSPLFAATQQLAYGEYILKKRNDRLSVGSVSLLDGYLPLRSDYDRTLHALYCASLALHLSQPEEDTEALFTALLTALAHLAYSEKSAAAITAYFLLKALQFAGYQPALHACAYCGKPGPFPCFQSKDGVVFCEECASVRNIHPRAVDWMRAVCELEDRPERLMDYPEPALQAVPLLMRYVEYRLEAHIKAGDLLPYSTE